MKIYIDLLLIQDTVFISTVLFIISKLISIKISIVRLLIVSFISSCISIMILMFIPDLFDNLLVKSAVSFFVVKYSLKIKDAVTIWQKVIMFWTVTFLVGGINFFSNGNFVQIIFLICVVTIYINCSRKNMKKQIFLDSASCILKIFYNNKEYCFKALLDTGHDVKTIYNEDVIFIRNNLLEIGGDSEKRIVSYKTISGIENKIGIKINNIKIEYSNKKICSNAVIVETPNITRNFDAIVSYDLIEGGMKNGDFGINKAESPKIVS